MRDSELKYPKWQTQFEEAVAEHDRDKLVTKIQSFEAAVFMRLQELTSNNHHEERQAIADALSILREVKRDKLSYPDWK